jgi:hypothetical protein
MHATFQGAESLLKLLDLVRIQSFGATDQDPSATHDE